MWFAWLLRPDARRGASLDDPEAQREFVIWWLLYGRAEYPAVWWFGLEQIAVAMEPVQIEGQRLPRLLRRLYLDRDDLRAAFPLNDAESVGDLLCWYRLSGPIELHAAPILRSEFLRLTEAPSGRLPWAASPAVLRIAAALHARQSQVKALFDPSIPAARAAIARWYSISGHRLIPAPTPPPEWTEPVPVSRLGATRQSLIPCGVNLVGFADAEFGIGEDVRSVSAALEAVGFPM